MEEGGRAGIPAAAHCIGGQGLKDCIDARVLFVLGTYAYHGYLYREVQYAVELGARPLDALRGVTSAAARVCRLDHRTGSLGPGLEADIIAVSGNPM